MPYKKKMLIKATSQLTSAGENRFAFGPDVSEVFGWCQWLGRGRILTLKRRIHFGANLSHIHIKVRSNIDQMKLSTMGPSKKG